MRLNKRGVALLQVLIISAVLAGLSTMILRATLSRTVMSRQTRKTVSAQMLIESCMVEVNAWWASKTPEVYAADLSACNICHEANTGNCTGQKQWTCTIENAVHGKPAYSVRADMTSGGAPCKIEYTVVGGVNTL